MASLCSKPTGLARLPGGEGGDLSVNCRPACHATGYLLLKQGRYKVLRYCAIWYKKKLTQKMRPFRAEFFVFKLFTYHIAPEPVLYMCVLELRLFLTGYTVAMVTCNVQKMAITCLPAIGHLFDFIIVGSTEKDFWH